MPTILRSGPYRFYVYSHEPNEPPHVHVDRDQDSCKVWLSPVALSSSLGFKARELRDIERLGERVLEVACTEDKLTVDLADGRSISVPQVWHPRLLHAPSVERDNWEVAGGGFGIHWPDIDEDLSVEGLLRGAPSARVKALSSYRQRVCR
ncbi:MAG: DUF2442 domain-containing protein [Cyanobium sp. CZS 25K]|nr:DUF2442 domain-containing protein [Cyanobium sp. CZS25K]